MSLPEPKFRLAALVAGLLSAASLVQAQSPTHAEEALAQRVEIQAQVAEAQAQEAWRGNVARSAPATEGCFTAHYPDVAWNPVVCAPPKTRSMREPARAKSLAVVGNRNDWVIQGNGIIRSAVGSFPLVTGVIVESGVPVNGGGGVLGPNEYSVQLNSNMAPSVLCGARAGCLGWQQFVYATDEFAAGTAAVHMQYWLLNYGTTCPLGWSVAGSSCFKNSVSAIAPDVPVTALASIQLSATATAGGYDTFVFTYGSVAYVVNAPDSVLGLAAWWQQAEFNVVGNAGSSMAAFNSGVTLAPHIAIIDGTALTPACVGQEGTTGETNNLTLGACTATGGLSPSITFIESD